MSLGSWHGCSACFSGSPALPPPQLFLPYRQTARPGWETQPPPMQGRAGSSSPGATCHPDTAKVTPQPSPAQKYQHPGSLAFPLRINRFTTGAYSKLSFFCAVSAIPEQKHFKQRREEEKGSQQIFSKQMLPFSCSIL